CSSRTDQAPAISGPDPEAEAMSRSFTAKISSLMKLISSFPATVFLKSLYKLKQSGIKPDLHRSQTSWLPGFLLKTIQQFPFSRAPRRPLLHTVPRGAAGRACRRAVATRRAHSRGPRSPRGRETHR